MFKKLVTFTMLILIVIGFGIGIYFSVFSKGETQEQKAKNEAIFGKLQTKQVEVEAFFTYGKCFNFSGKLAGVPKDNFESAKLYVTDGNGFEETFALEGEIEEGNLKLFTINQMNKGLILDDLRQGQYVVLVRIKMNNSVNPKYYSLSNHSEYPDIEYYTMTKEGKNNKVNIHFKNQIYDEHDYEYLSLDVAQVEKPKDVYDIVIDAGHGGKDVGEKSGADTEADIALSYAKLLKQRLEAQGLSVKLTRDDSNTDTYTSTNMYDENGRITIACKSKAKMMLSFHMNNGNSGLKGLEIYAPSKCDLEFAQNMANKIVTFTNLEYSNNHSFKKGEGVYVRNFTKSIINDYTATANKKGYEPYQITLDTPYLYTIREVGGIATNAYVDGRNTSYSANQFYHSNQGIECYQIEMGYMKNDLEIIKNEIEQYVTAISEAVLENL